MRTFVFLVALLLTLAYATASASPRIPKVTLLDGRQDLPSYYDLQLVQVLIRHGDRTPIRAEPPKAKVDWWLPPGQLTVWGMRQHDSLGHLLRGWYVDGKFLNESWQQERVHIRSTDVDRTLMSAQCLFFGLFPEGTGPVDPQTGESIGNRFQPVPIHTVEHSADTMLVSHSLCNAFQDWKASLYKSAEFLEKERNESDFIDAVRTASGLPNLTLSDWDDIDDPVLCAYIHGFKRLQGFTDDDYQRIFDIATWIVSVASPSTIQFWLTNETTQRKRLYPSDNMQVHKWVSGNLANQLLSTMLGTINGTLSKRFILYSAHDTTLMSLLSGLQLYDGNIPPYASFIVTELFNDTRNGNYFVRMIFNNKTLVFDSCSNDTGLCSLENVTSFFSLFHLDIDTWEAECNIPKIVCVECNPSWYPPVWTAVVMLVLVVVTLISWVLAMIFFREKLRTGKKLRKLKQEYEPLET